MKLEDDIGYNCMICQCESGANLTADSLLRTYVEDVNVKLWMHGFEHLSYSFSILRAFFNFNFDVDYFELLEEEDYEISLIDFLDFVTTYEFEDSKELVDENLENDLIYNYNFTNDPLDFTFSAEGSPEFVIGSVSIIRKEYEVVMLIHGGKKFDRAKMVKDIKESTFVIPPGKKSLVGDKMKKAEPVLFNGLEEYLQLNAIFRFDIENLTLQTRHIAEDMSVSYRVASDDITKYIDIETLEFRSEEKETLYKNNLEKLQEFIALEELAKNLLYLPHYINSIEDKLTVTEKRTEFSSKVNIPRNRKYLKKIPSKYRISNRSIWSFEGTSKATHKRVTLQNNIYKTEKSGFWKSIGKDELGVNKSGKEVLGKTWVNKTLSWIEPDSEAVTVHGKTLDYTDENSGYIYLMRNPLMPKGIFKIGLTRNETDDRAKQLSTTGVADRFYVLNEWPTKDCVTAEKEIHKILEAHRVDARREFFQIETKDASEVIEKVTININEDAT